MNLLITGSIILGVALGGSWVFEKKKTDHVSIVERITLPETATNVTPVSLTSKQIKTLSLTEKDTVLIEGEIGEDAKYIAQEITQKSLTNKELYILISSPGGSVLDGALIISAIEAAKIPVNTVCLDSCASMAAMIHGFGTKRLMVDRSILMFHPAAGGIRGTLEEMQSLLTTITNYVNKMDVYIANRAGLTEKQFHDMWVSQLWMDAETAVAKKFADGYVNLNLESSKKKSVFIVLPSEDSAKEKFNIKW